MSDRLGMGAIPDIYDSRDKILFNSDHIEPARQMSRQLATDNKGPFILKDLPPVYNQGHIGSCVANVALAALRFAVRRNLSIKYDDFTPSRLFAYREGRANMIPAETETDLLDESLMEWRISHNVGSTTRVTIGSFVKRGVCKEELWPYGNYSADGPFFDVEQDKDGNPIKPNAIEPENYTKALREARDYIPSAISFYRIIDPSFKMRQGVNMSQKDQPLAWDVQGPPTIDLLQRCLLGGYPFIFSVWLFKSAGLNNKDWTDRLTEKFYKADVDENGLFVKPPTNQRDLEETDGGHSLLAVGFDASKRLFYVQNSWGEEWPSRKMGGRFWMPYEWFEKGHTFDFWVVQCADKTFTGEGMKYNPAHFNYGNLETLKKSTSSR